MSNADIIDLLSTILLFFIILVSCLHILKHEDNHDTVDNEGHAEPQQATLSTTPSKETP